MAGGIIDGLEEFWAEIVRKRARLGQWAAGLLPESALLEAIRLLVTA